MFQCRWYVNTVSFDSSTLLDVIPVRNQLLEIDTVNTSVVGTVDQTATTGRGYTVTTTGGAGSTTGTATTTTTTVTTTSSTATSSSY